ncbi:hypothetical protein HDU67_007834 [Dinochytrium kinnereticum]|nr:hypothetical protein HDU67_007834 [Dinochytrium kinnereticum]
MRSHQFILPTPPTPHQDVQSRIQEWVRSEVLTRLLLHQHQDPNHLHHPEPTAKEPSSHLASPTPPAPPPQTKAATTLTGDVVDANAGRIVHEAVEAHHHRETGLLEREERLSIALTDHTRTVVEEVRRVLEAERVERAREEEMRRRIVEAEERGRREGGGGGGSEVALEALRRVREVEMGSIGALVERERERDGERERERVRREEEERRRREEEERRRREEEERKRREEEERKRREEMEALKRERDEEVRRLKAEREEVERLMLEEERKRKEKEEEERERKKREERERERELELELEREQQVEQKKEEQDTPKKAEVTNIAIQVSPPPQSQIHESSITEPPTIGSSESSSVGITTLSTMLSDGEVVTHFFSEGEVLTGLGDRPLFRLLRHQAGDEGTSKDDVSSIIDPNVEKARPSHPPAQVKREDSSGEKSGSSKSGTSSGEAVSLGEVSILGGLQEVGEVVVGLGGVRKESRSKEKGKEKEKERDERIPSSKASALLPLVAVQVQTSVKGVAIRPSSPSHYRDDSSPSPEPDPKSQKDDFRRPPPTKPDLPALGSVAGGQSVTITASQHDRSKAVLLPPPTPASKPTVPQPKPTIIEVQAQPNLRNSAEDDDIHVITGHDDTDLTPEAVDTIAKEFQNASSTSDDSSLVTSDLPSADRSSSSTSSSHRPTAHQPAPTTTPPQPQRPAVSDILAALQRTTQSALSQSAAFQMSVLSQLSDLSEASTSEEEEEEDGNVSSVSSAPPLIDSSSNAPPVVAATEMGGSLSSMESLGTFRRRVVESAAALRPVMRSGTRDAEDTPGGSKAMVGGSIIPDPRVVLAEEDRRDAVTPLRKSSTVAFPELSPIGSVSPNADISSVSFSLPSETDSSEPAVASTSVAVALKEFEEEEEGKKTVKKGHDREALGGGALVKAVLGRESGKSGDVEADMSDSLSMSSLRELTSSSGSSAGSSRAKKR